MDTNRLSLINLPIELAQVALVDAKACAAAGGMSVSNWYLLVRDGVAPRPAVRLTRYTRWRLVDVRRFFIAFAEQGQLRDEGVVMERARKASQAAKVKRQQKALNPPKAS